MDSPCQRPHSARCHRFVRTLLWRIATTQGAIRPVALESDGFATFRYGAFTGSSHAEVGSGTNKSAKRKKACATDVNPDSP